MRDPTPKERAAEAVRLTGHRDFFGATVADVYVLGVLVCDGLALAAAEPRVAALRSQVERLIEDVTAKAPEPDPKRWAPQRARIPADA